MAGVTSDISPAISSASWGNTVVPGSGIGSRALPTPAEGGGDQGGREILAGHASMTDTTSWYSPIPWGSQADSWRNIVDNICLKFS